MFRGKKIKVKYFKVKHKVLKISIHVQIWSEFENFLLKFQAQLEFFQNGRYNNPSRQIPVLPEENQNHKSQFSDEFRSCLLEKNFPTEPVGSF
jgi:hypothetical protein